MANKPRNVTLSDAELATMDFEACYQAMIPRRRQLFDLLPEHDWNVGKAGLAMGYRKTYAQGRLQHMIREDRVFCRAMALQRKALAAATGVTPERIIEEYARIAFANQDDYMRVGRGGEPYVDLSKTTRDQRAAIAGIDEAGEKTGAKIRLHSKPVALEALARMHGLFEKDNNQKRSRPVLVVNVDAQEPQVRQVPSVVVEEVPDEAV